MMRSFCVLKKIESINNTIVTDGSRIILATSPYNKYEYGNKIELLGTVESPKDFITDTGKTFDYDNYLKLSNVYGIMRDPEIKIIKEFDGNKIKKV